MMTNRRHVAAALCLLSVAGLSWSGAARATTPEWERRQAEQARERRQAEEAYRRTQEQQRRTNEENARRRLQEEADRLRQQQRRRS